MLRIGNDERVGTASRRHDTLDEGSRGARDDGQGCWKIGYKAVEVGEGESFARWLKRRAIVGVGR